MSSRRLNWDVKSPDRLVSSFFFFKKINNLLHGVCRQAMVEIRRHSTYIQEREGEIEEKEKTEAKEYSYANKGYSN